MKSRLDVVMVERGLAATRSQASTLVDLGKVLVNGGVAQKPAVMVGSEDKITFSKGEQYVSRAGYKLASVAKKLNVNFRDSIVLDVGSSTGGFTDFALQHGAKKVVAVDVGTNQLHPSLRGNEHIELHEKTDIRNFKTEHIFNVVVIDVSFISVRQVLPAVGALCSRQTQIVVMVKPQFEAEAKQANKGVVKNEAVRRTILNDFEHWAKRTFVVLDKADSDVSGSKGNQERFYMLRLSANSVVKQ